MTILAAITEQLAAGDLEQATRLLDEIQAQVARLQAVAAHIRGDAGTAAAHRLAAAGGAGPFLELGRSWRSAGHAALAVAAVEAALALEPRNAGALVLRGELQRNLGDRATARASFAAAAEADPSSFWAHLHLAEEHRHAGNLAAAEAATDVALRISPGDAQALVSSGLCARAAGDRDRALARFRAARVADPTNRWGWLNLAEELRDAGATAEAEAILHEMLTQFPADSQALIGLGLCARLRGDQVAARDLLARATAADAGNGWAWLHLAREALDLRDLPAAEDAGRRAEALLPDQGPVLVLLANCARLRGADEEAIERFRLATRHDPGNPWAWIGLANLHRGRREWDAARDALKACL